ncbi:ankyrin repeat domain-containing protein [Marinicella meishanensis]|uniref:ankyrin repeat domain-containing protein n=1 Tax=Marinicella meishanensis TaxID=2873263 RepID=UPI001CBA89E9|nr:ankyrin repeat domain-containing protein [Marinicella sp. NBU2979]
MHHKLRSCLILLISSGIIFSIAILVISKSLPDSLNSEDYDIFANGTETEIIEFLEKSESKVNINSYYSLIRRDGYEILELIFQKYNLDPDYGFKNQGGTPLLFAAKNFKPKAVEILIDYGAKVNYLDPYGVTPLIATSYTTLENENSESFEITKLLVYAGADINVVSEFGQTAIEGALFSNDIRRVKFLVDNNGDINHLSPTGANYMFFCDYLECYEFFLSKGFDINSTDNAGSSIFQVAHYSSIPLSLTKQLLNWGADICHKDDLGDSVLNYIERRGTGPHDKNENPDFYFKMLSENRQSVAYKYLENEYNLNCQE